jgi:hypothetical protein
MNEPGEPPPCVPLWCEESLKLLAGMEQELFELLGPHGRVGTTRSAIALAIRGLRHEVHKLARLGEE